MDWELCQTQLQDLSAERAAMILAHKAMLNGSCLILACNHMGQGLSMFTEKALSYKVLQRRALAFQKKTTNQPTILTWASASSYGSTKTVVVWIRISSWEQKKKSKSICWLSYTISPKSGFQRSVSGVNYSAMWGHMRLLLPAQPRLLHTYFGTVCFWVTFHILHSSESLKATNHPRRGRTWFPAVTTHSKYSCTLTSNISNLWPLL